MRRLLLLAAVIATTSPVLAWAGGQCGAFFGGGYSAPVVVQRKAVVARKHGYSKAAVVQHHKYAVEQPYVHYQVGSALREEAIAERAARRALEKLVALQEYERLQAGSGAGSVRGDVASGGGSSPPPPPPPGVLESRQSVLELKCSKCHTTEKFAGQGLVFDGKTPLAAASVTAALRALRDNTMPKGGPQLTPAEKADAMQELLSLEQ